MKDSPKWKIARWIFSKLQIASSFMAEIFFVEKKLQEFRITSGDRPVSSMASALLTEIRSATNNLKTKKYENKNRSSDNYLQFIHVGVRTNWWRRWDGQWQFIRHQRGFFIGHQFWQHG
jgi:hypothetical protein